MSASTIPSMPHLSRGARLSGATASLSTWRLAVLLATATWVPLMLLAIGAWFVDRRVPIVELLRDVEVHVRSLVAVPILVLAEKPVFAAFDGCVRHFPNSGLVADDDPVFVASVRKLRRRLSSRVASVLLVVAAVIGSIANAMHVGPWAYRPGGGATLGWAGAWQTLVAAPVYHFLAYRWVYRWVVWDLFVISATRMRLRLYATHADKSAGLAFLVQPAISFAIVLFASSSVIASRWCLLLTRVPAAETTMRFALIVYLALIIGITIAPFLAYVPKLVRLRRDAVLAYGVLAQKASRAFDARWNKSNAPAGEAFLESNDPSAIVDYGSDYALARNLRVIPIALPELLTIVVVALAPMTSLAIVDRDIAQAVRLLLKAVF
jgi:hypothetical protein